MLQRSPYFLWYLPGYFSFNRVFMLFWYLYTVPVQVLYRTGLFVFCNRIEIKSNGREPDAAPKRVGKVLKKKYPT